MLTKNEINDLIKKRERLFTAWETAPQEEKNSFVVQISDIDEDLAFYQPEKKKITRKFVNNNINLIMHE